MTHVDLTKSLILQNLLGKRLHLAIIKRALDQVKLIKRKDLEQLRYSLTTELVVIKVDVFEVLSTFDRLNQRLSSFVINIIIGQEKLSQSVASGYELSYLVSSSCCDLIVR